MPSTTFRVAMVGLAAVLFVVYVFAALKIVAEIDKASPAMSADLSTR